MPLDDGLQRGGDRQGLGAKMTIAADDTFILAMVYVSDAVYQRRSADHFGGEHRQTLARRADELSTVAMNLVQVSVGADTAQGQ